MPKISDQNTPLGEQVTNFFSVGEFYLLFSREHMLALLIFSFLLGISLQRIPREKTAIFCRQQRCCYGGGYKINRNTVGASTVTRITAD